MSHRCTNSTPSSAPSTRAWSCDYIVAFETCYHGLCMSHFFKSSDSHSTYKYSCVQALLGMHFSKIGNILIGWWSDQWLDVRGSCMQWQQFSRLSFFQKYSFRKGPCMDTLSCSLAWPTGGRLMSSKWIHPAFLMVLLVERICKFFMSRHPLSRISFPIEAGKVD